MPHRHPCRHGDWPVKPAPPFVPGHEGVAVVELGTGVTEVAIGDRVAMPWLGYACGTCDYCVSGWRRSASSRNTGYSIDGGFGEYAPRTRATSSRCPRESTRSTRRRSVRRRHDVQGAQGRGHAPVRPRGDLWRRRSRSHGDPVRGDRGRQGRCRRPDRREARALPRARRRVHGERGEEDPVKAIQRLGGADQAIALAVSRSRSSRRPLAQARRNARLRGASRRERDEAPIFETVLNGITVIGSIVGTRTDLREVFELHAAGKTTVEREIRPLDEVNQAIEDVEAGHVPAGSSSGRSGQRKRALPGRRRARRPSLSTTRRRARPRRRGRRARPAAACAAARRRSARPCRRHRRRGRTEGVAILADRCQPRVERLAASRSSKPTTATSRPGSTRSRAPPGARRAHVIGGGDDRGRRCGSATSACASR